MIKTDNSRQLDFETSCLSPYVRNILQDHSDEPIPAHLECLTKNGTLNWTFFTDYLSVESPAEVCAGEAYYVKCSKWLAPISRLLSQRWSLIQQDVPSLFQWTSSPKLLLDAFELCRSGEETDVVSSLLLSTSVLERSLGDVFILQGDEVCPSMLKDLLVTSQLINIFSSTAMELLRILIGPPISLNIRNLVWHGFPSPIEIPRHYASFLLCVISSLGQLLLDKGICFDDIPHRSFVVMPQLSWLQTSLTDDGLAIDSDGLEALFQQSSFVSPHMLPYWISAVRKLKEERYCECVMLLLPQLEHGLRRLFVVANDSPARMITAESTKLFTTLDQILRPLLDDGSENQLRYAIGDDCLALLLDVFVREAGPRLRDRVSHGEVDAAALPRQTALSLLALAACLCSLTQTRPRQGIPLGLHCTIAHYESKFHPIALLKRQINETAISLSKWRDIARPTEMQIGSAVTWQNPVDVSKVVAYGAAKKILANQRRCEHLFCIVSPFEDIAGAVCVVMETPITTLYRPSELILDTTSQKRESQMLSLLGRIAHECIGVSEHVYVGMRSKYDQWQARELRSRQRQTYARMLDSTPIVSSGIRLALLLVIVHLLSIDDVSSMSAHTYNSIVKLLKDVLQYVENMKSCTNISKNKWDVAIELTDKFCQA